MLSRIRAIADRLEIRADDLVASFGFVSFLLSLFGQLRFAAVPLALVFLLVWCGMRLRERRLRRQENQERIAANRRLHTVFSQIERSRNPRDLILDAAESMGLPDGWRVSIYQKSDVGWTRVARLADVHDFDLGGRGTLPAGQGVLGSAARLPGALSAQGASDESGPFPDASTDRASWLQMQEDWGIPAVTAESLRMPARKYASVVRRLLRPGEADVLYAAVVECLGIQDSLLPRVRQHFSRTFFTSLDKVLLLEPLIVEASDLIEKGRQTELRSRDVGNPPMPGS